MTPEEKARAKDARDKKHPGFGRAYTMTEWVRLTRIPKATMRRYLNNGMTIEEIFKLRDIPPTVVDDPGSADAKGAKQLDVEQIISRLLELSGYNSAGITSSQLPRNAGYSVSLDGAHIGDYRIHIGTLILNSGETIRTDLIPNGMYRIEKQGDTWHLVRPKMR